MRIDFSKIDLEGAKIVRVIEDMDRHKLTFEMSYPIPEGGSGFPQRKIIFQSCSRYLVYQGMWLPGEPTIERVEIIKLDAHRMTICMHTDQGVREVICSTSVLE